MSLRIIYGRAGSGKTSKCYEYIDEFLSHNGDKIIFLVPEHFSLSVEKTVAKRYDFGKMSRIDVLSFERMAQYVFSKVGPVGCEYLNSTGKSIIMQSIFNDVSNKLISFKKATQKSGFVNMMVDTISEFKKNGITPEVLKKIADETTDVNFKFKLSDFILIYEKYNNYLNFPIADSDDDLIRLCYKIKEFNLFGNCHIIADGFTGFTPNQTEVLRCLMTYAKSLTVSLTADSLEEDKTGVFLKSIYFAKKLYEIAYECKTEVLPNVYTGECKKFSECAELNHLERNYYSYPHNVYDDKTENIKIIKASNYTAEVEKVASEIVRLCRENKLRYRDITVASRDFSNYYPLIKSIFDEYLIKYHIDEKLYVMKNSYTYALLSPFDILIYNFNRESMTKWIKSPLCRIDDDDKYLLENYLYEHGCTLKMWENDTDWTFKGDYSDEEMQRINNAKNTARTPVINFYKRFSGRKTVLEIATAYIDFLNEVKADEVTVKLSKELRREGLLTESDSITAVYNCIMNTVSEMVRLFVESKITFEKFYSVLTSGLEGCGAGQIPHTVDCVNVTDVERIKSDGIKCLFILGVSDGVFPRGYIKDGLFSSHDREEISEKCGVKLETPMDLHKNEEYVIYNALSSPDNYLYLSYPCSDNEGKRTIPSVIINRIKSIFPNVTEISDIYSIKKDVLSSIEGVIPTFNKMMIGKSKLNDALKNWYRQNRPMLYEMAVATEKYTNLPSMLYKENVRLLYGDEMLSSISKAEKYAKCGFSFFLQYGLRAKERRDNKMQVNDAGTFLHAIVEEYSRFATDFGWDKIDKDLCLKKSSEITEKVLKEGLNPTYFESASNRYSVRKFIKTVSLTLWNITEYYKESEFSPLGFEIGFGGNSEYPPIEIDLENGEKVRLTGKVDRADIWRTEDGNFISIVDYKSSDKKIDLNQLLCGVQIQLPVYIDAICKSLKTKEPTAIPAAINYYHVYSPTVEGKNITDEELEKAVKNDLRMKGYTLDLQKVQSGIGSMYFIKKTADIKGFEKIIKTAYDKLTEILSEIRDGKIDINPMQNPVESCKYCPYKIVCNFDTKMCGNEYRTGVKTTEKEFFQK